METEISLPIFSSMFFGRSLWNPAFRVGSSVDAHALGWGRGGGRLGELAGTCQRCGGKYPRYAHGLLGKSSAENDRYRIQFFFGRRQVATSGQATLNALLRFNVPYFVLPCGLYLYTRGVKQSFLDARNIVGFQYGYVWILGWGHSERFVLIERL